MCDRDRVSDCCLFVPRLRDPPADLAVDEGQSQKRQILVQIADHVRIDRIEVVRLRPVGGAPATTKYPSAAQMFGIVAAVHTVRRQRASHGNERAPEPYPRRIYFGAIRAGVWGDIFA